ncbi:MAG: hypothetical protein ACK52I_35595, partial [Pseudomonadota bacterium]
MSNFDPKTLAPALDSAPDEPTDADLALAAAMTTLHNRQSAQPNIVQGKQEGDGNGTPPVQVRVTSTEDALLTEEEVYAEASRLASLDDGRQNYAAVRATLEQELARVQRDLDAVRYDVYTGEPRHIHTGANREAKERTAALIKQRLVVNEVVSKMVEEVRAERAEFAEAERRHQETVFAWTGGDPRRIEVLNRAIEELEARDLAERLIEERRRLDAERFARRKARTASTPKGKSSAAKGKPTDGDEEGFLTGKL